MNEYSIPREIAIKLCNEVRKENQNKLFNSLSYQCIGCYKFSKGDYEKMCFNNKHDNKGCYMINVKYLKYKYE